MPVVAAFILPNVFKPLLASPATPWQAIARAYGKVEAALASARPDVVVVYASGWVSETLQLWLTAPKIEGARGAEIDGQSVTVPVDLAIDAEVAEACVIGSKAIGIESEAVRDPNFPVDLAALAALRLIEPQERSKRLILSSATTHDFGQAERLGGFAAAVSGDRFRRRVALIGIGDMAVPEKSEDWLRIAIDKIVRGEVYELRQHVNPYRADRAPNLDLKHVAFLLGGMGGVFSGAIVHASGPGDRADAAVIEFKL
jgi:hypothetical protein